MEREIIHLIKSRDEKGITELLVHCTPLINYIISPILENPADRDECLSEISMKVWNKIEQYDEAKGSFNGWLTAIARNTALNKAKQIKNNLSTEEIHTETASDSPGPEEILLQREKEKALKNALNTLSGKDKELFYRKYYYMQSTAQIARELSTTERAVEGKLYRIKKKLRKILGGDGNG
ncbi:MAG: sigma-70 family RNA polymerase sigma factor [Clostridia bacterium]|nr:sigma-70 family RNA polymerase sigma factor [Clostridia bacterium]